MSSGTLRKVVLTGAIAGLLALGSVPLMAGGADPLDGVKDFHAIGAGASTSGCTTASGTLKGEPVGTAQYTLVLNCGAGAAPSGGMPAPAAPPAAAAPAAAPAAPPAAAPKAGSGTVQIISADSHQRQRDCLGVGCESYKHRWIQHCLWHLFGT